MTDPSYALQKAVFDALIASNAVGSKVYHRVPAGTALPYIFIGQDQIIPDEDSAGEFSDCYATIHVFAETMPALKLIVGAVRNALARDLPLIGFNVQLGRLDNVTYRTDTDGEEQIEHAIMTFAYTAQAL